MTKLNFRLAAALLAVILCLGAACSSGRQNPPQKAGGMVEAPTPYALSIPAGLPHDGIVIPADNPITLQKVKLGRRLYFEKRLSSDGSVSCATCHNPEEGFADRDQYSIGVRGLRGNRHSPTVINRVFSAAQFWDGRASSLEEQALMPVQNPVEMGMIDIEPILKILRSDPAYVRDFAAAFPPDGEISARNMGRAIAHFERTILSGNSPYDKYVAGDRKALSPSAIRGMKVFQDEQKGNCETCHAGPNFSDENYYNIGVGMKSRSPDMGRHKVTGLEGHQGAFKTPTLRDVAQRSPYMHDGSQKTLEEVVAFYVRGGHPNRWLSAKIKKLKLTAQEQTDLVEFLKALTGEVSWHGRESQP